MARDNALTIAFTHSDAHVAQGVTKDLVDLLLDAGRAQSVHLTVIDPVSVATEAIRPGVGRVFASGLLAGLLTGMLVAACLALVRRQPPAQNA